MSLTTLEVKTREQWRTWLREHHDSVSEIWVVFRKGGAPTLAYEDAIGEALCWGWVDSLIKRLDEERYARKFTPRKADSRWSTANRRRYADLEARGLLQAPGRERPPTERSGDAPRVSLTAIPAYIEKALKENARVWDSFERLAPSCRRAYIGWIDSAKREETRRKRLGEAVRMIGAGEKLGLK